MSIRTALPRMLRTAAWVRRRQRVKIVAAPVKVNLGSGIHVAPGWINVDGGVHAMCSRWPRHLLRLLYRHSDCRRTLSQADYLRILRHEHFVHHALEYGVPFAADTVDFIYTSHMLEHLFKRDAAILLRDARRVLKSGGQIRVAVPDLAYALRLYRQVSKEEAMSFFFSTGSAGYLDQHHYMYDFDLLQRLLEEAGFTRVRLCAFQTGECPDLQVLDNRPEETLFVEATK